MNLRNAVIIIVYCIRSMFCLPADGQNQKTQTPKALATILTSFGFDISPKTLTDRQTNATPLKNTIVSRKKEPEAMPSRYTVDYGTSDLIAITGKSRLFSFAGHNHAVVATNWSAIMHMTPTDIAHSSVIISVETAGLVNDRSAARQITGLGPGPNPREIPAIQKHMLSDEVLDIQRYPLIKFTSTTVKAERTDALRVSGDFELHGHRRYEVVPVRYWSDRGRMALNSKLVIRQTDYGFTPESVAGGTIKVKDDVVIRTASFWQAIDKPSHVLSRAAFKMISRISSPWTAFSVVATR